MIRKCGHMKGVLRDVVSKRLSVMENLRKDLIDSVTMAFESETKTITDLLEYNVESLDHLVSQFQGLQTVIGDDFHDSSRAAVILSQLPQDDYESAAEESITWEVSFTDKTLDLL
jgi:hypothetical protein